MKNKNSIYLFLTILLVILSTIGGYFLFNMYQARIFPVYTSTSVPKIELLPTDSIEQNNTTTSSSITVTPAVSSSTKEKANILQISDIQLTFPESWIITSNTDKTAKILTDFKNYQVYLTLNLEKNTSNAINSYNLEGRSNPIKTQYGEIYPISSGGGAGMIGALLNNNKYIFQWDIESNQKPPTDLDGIWIPDHNITEKSLLDITKTVQPLIKTSTSISPTKIPTIIVTKTPVSTSGTVSYQSKEDGFSISYSKLRQLHQDTESSGNRYTFVNKSGNFAIHVSPTGKWSWAHPSRQFTSTLLVSGKNTFRYDIDTQTIIDLQSDENNYTLQCIHNGVESLKTECDQFVSSFKLL